MHGVTPDYADVVRFNNIVGHGIYKTRSDAELAVAKLHSPPLSVEYLDLQDSYLCLYSLQ